MPLPKAAEPIKAGIPTAGKAIAVATGKAVPPNIGSASLKAVPTRSIVVGSATGWGRGIEAANASKSASDNGCSEVNRLPLMVYVGIINLPQ
jgi:hypothetical protein